MRILCPLCGFAREVDESKIPPRAQMATCPKCAHKFRFRVVDDLEPEAGAPGAPHAGQAAAARQGEQGLGTPVDAPADPMAAQRAAAAAAWKRLQDSRPGKSLDAPGADALRPDQDDQAQATPGPEFPASPKREGGVDTTGSFGPSSGPAPGPASEAPSSPSFGPSGAGGQSWPEPGAPKSTGSPVPFEDLPRHGFFSGLWATIRTLLTKPGEFFRAMPVADGMAKPLIFHVLLAEFMVACQYVWSLAGIGATAQYIGSPELMQMGLGASGAAPVLLLVVYPLLLVLRLMLMTGVVHLLLRLLRSGGAGAEATFRVLCYSAAPLALGIFPVLGPLVGGIWSIVLTILGLKVVHRTSMAASMFAVFVPILLLLAALVGLMQGLVQAG
ncbi:hypothetical protein SAMN04488503_1360 [Humidesulfovibrio mexicanus]|uniref:Yip1 domain-containing protein n=1 Tax=Humidesulfovibrio mexicanus TaxID=147047 RepID=A0A238ZB99_9BACT|nr:YIP1 family protein [Humidesulfovibrio mexicanus]SNR80053.1 hypothetical protein SAMN04488503_1360 [Humidesulfovibrio mexicanus]